MPKPIVEDYEAIALARSSPREPKECGIDLLARVLHEELEHLDPIGLPTWNDTTEGDREVMRGVVDRLLQVWWIELRNRGDLSG